MNDLSVTLQCESWTLHNHWHGNGGWCTRNSKIGLSHPQMGEVMFATWLLPYNEAVAQWIDPFYDAGSDSHTSIMGGVGGSSIYHSPGYWGNPRNTEDRDPRYAIGNDTGFNRRQEEIIQYFSPSWNGFKVRFAWTAGYEDENSARNGRTSSEVDPVIRSASLVYENGPLWLATTWQDHEDWTASRTAMAGTMTGSEAESIRLAGRYIFDMGDGISVQIAAMWEDLEYKFHNVSSVDEAMSKFGFYDENYGFAKTYRLVADEPADFVPQTLDPFSFNPETSEADKDHVRAEKSYGLLADMFGTEADSNDNTITRFKTIPQQIWFIKTAGPDGNDADTDADSYIDSYVVEDPSQSACDLDSLSTNPGDICVLGTFGNLAYDGDASDNMKTLYTGDDTTDDEFNSHVNIFTRVMDNPDTTDDESVDADGKPVFHSDAVKLKEYLTAFGALTGQYKNEIATEQKKIADARAEIAKLDPVSDTSTIDAEKAKITTAEGVIKDLDLKISQYDELVAVATSRAEVSAQASYDQDKAGHETAEQARREAHEEAEDAKTLREEIGGDVKIEREAWMVSGKIKFGGPVDFRFSYMEAEDLEISCGACTGDWSETGANAWNVGVFYTMPGGTELRMTYSEVDNETNGTYAQGVSGTGYGQSGYESEMFAVGIVHWFD